MRHLFATAAFAAALISAPGLAATTLRFGHANNDGELATDLFQEFADKVTQRTKGEVTIKVFPAEQLGKEADLIQQVKSGALDISAPSMPVLSSWCPRWRSPAHPSCGPTGRRPKR